MQIKDKACNLFYQTILPELVARYFSRKAKGKKTGGGAVILPMEHLTFKARALVPVSDKSVVRAPGTTKNFYGQLTNPCVVARGQPKRCRVQ